MVYTILQKGFCLNNIFKKRVFYKFLQEQVSQ